MKLDLSILELGNTLPPKVYAHQVIENLFEWVYRLESLGFSRFWMSEHYSPEFAWYSPETFLPLLVGNTKRISIGQAGVLLNYHSPLAVAHNFSILSALFPNRIDLGVVPARISEEATQALIGKIPQQDQSTFQEKIQQLYDLFSGKPLNDENPDSLHLPLQGTNKPNLWMLGTSGSSIPNAVKYKANFCISLFHQGAQFEKQKDTIKRFKDHYFKTHGEVPSGVASVLNICTKREKTIRKLRNQIGENVQPEGYIIGSPDYCEERIQTLAHQLNLEEIVLSIPGSSLEMKRETTELMGTLLQTPVAPIGISALV